MASRYEKLKKEEKSIKRLVKLGVVDYTIQRNILIFEEFKLNPELCAECRYEILAYEHKLSSDTIKKIVLDLKRECA